MEKETVIKALEWCSNVQLCCLCPVGKERGEPNSIHNCCQALMKEALALIKELTQANEQLSESYDHLEKTKDELLSERARLTEENERLKSEVSVKKKLLDKCVDLEDRVKSNTVREIFKEIYSSLDYIEEQMEPEEIPECFFSVREDINALKEKFESEGRGE